MLKRHTLYVPQALLTYLPGNVYVKQTISFDASDSSVEGINDSFVRYQWNFGDGSPTQQGTTSSFAHSFNTVGTYIVTANVTDTEGLWCAISKPVAVKPPDPPIANFTWSPVNPAVNQTILFDASVSLPGWNGTTNIPIISYRWNFGDGNASTVTTSTTPHKYKIVGNYTVALTVTDANGLQSSKTLIVQITRHAQLPGDVNGDGKVDGKDIAIVSRAYNTKPGDPKWDSRADVNGDLKVDGKDVAIVSKYYGT